jgi:hypothetical protein
MIEDHSFSVKMKIDARLDSPGGQDMSEIFG